MFRIRVRVRYQGKLYTAVGYDHATKLYTLTRRSEVVLAEESALMVVSG